MAASSTPSATTCRPRQWGHVADGAHDAFVVRAAAHAAHKRLVDFEPVHRKALL
ncbi:MAG: hypothetical protein R3E55_08725 [Burkholderiaceae bacterium]|nr:hypothetical protein [Burkholderiaceae bacterium]MCO5111706.1 hypothetical protein [Burkholderiaceae bacterium]